MEVLGDIWILAQRSVTPQTLLLQAALDNENFITVAQRALPFFIGVTSRVYYPFPSPLIFFILWSLCPVRLNYKRLITTHKGGGTQKTPCPVCSLDCLQYASQTEGSLPQGRGLIVGCRG